MEKLKELENRSLYTIDETHCKDGGLHKFVKDDEYSRCCSQCGYSPPEVEEDRGPEWKAINPEDKIGRVRVGPPQTQLLHDSGLTTDISQQPYDYQGRPLDANARAAATKMRTWQSRIRTSDSSERVLAGGLSVLERVLEKLKLPRNTEETAGNIYKKMHKNHISKSKSILPFAAAVAYVACRKCEVERSLKEVARVANVERTAMSKYVRLMLRDNEYILPQPTVEKCISRIINRGKINPVVERYALKLAYGTHGYFRSGKASRIWAAAYVYMASVFCGEYLTQKDIAALAELTEVTVRNRCRDILDNYRIIQKLKPVKSQGRYGKVIKS